MFKKKNIKNEENLDINLEELQEELESTEPEIKQENKNVDNNTNNNSDAADKKWSNVFKSTNPEKDKEISIIEKLTNENKILKDNILIISADLENTRKRHQEELEKKAKFSIGKFSEDLIPVMDAFYLAMDSVKKENIDTNSDFKNLFDGMSLTFNELKKVFERNNIIRINPLGEQFNHNFHQAISQIESDEPEGVVVFVMQAGYMLNGRLLKPALVGISKGK